MLTLRSLLLLVAISAATGCGANVVQFGEDGGAGDAPGPTDAPGPAPVDVPRPNPVDVPRPNPVDVPAPVDVQRPCATSADCGAGQECMVREGCGVPTFCGPRLGRPCTADFVPFCGCDGMTFSGSSTCPPRSYSHRGPCEAIDAGPGGCAFPDGRVCPLGQTCRAPDGCNTCTCSRDGSLRCTTLGCIDAGPPACLLSNGALCPLGSSCPSPDGCNTCTCGRDGRLACTERACVDAGPLVCELPDGRTCGVGQTCLTGECGSCFCWAPGRLTCTAGCVDAGTPVDVPLPRSCRSSSDCPSSMICDGPQGCGTIWTCTPARGCTADLSPFCGCDGRSFASSSSCVGQPYQHRGPCAVDAGVSDGGAPSNCAPQDARGEGACGGFFGYAWDGSRCVGVSGCRCVGADCGRIVTNPRQCLVDHETCAVPF